MQKRLNLLRWSSRKLLLPIYGGGLNLDVGSGGNPHPMADVLLEKYVDDTHRYHGIKVDRTTILADACKMPFANNAFNFVFAFHVLEHMHQPAEFLEELQRVGKRGYIETPNSIYERITPYSMHLLEIFHLNNKLYIYKKSGPAGDDYIGCLRILENDKSWKHFFSSNPKYFHSCYSWEDEINFEIINPDASTSWFVDPQTQSADMIAAKAPKMSFRSLLLKLVKSARNVKVDLNSILVCPECKYKLGAFDGYYRCTNSLCCNEYSRDPLPDFNKPL